MSRFSDIKPVEFSTDPNAVSSPVHRILGRRAFFLEPTFPGDGSGAPTTRTWAEDELYVDDDRALWICTAGGTPGTWRLLFGAGDVYDSVSLTADDTELTVTGFAGALLVSDSAVATDRTIVMPDGDFDGQTFLLRWMDATNRAELLNGGNVNTQSDWRPTDSWHMQMLMWDGVIGRWNLQWRIPLAIDLAADYAWTGNHTFSKNILPSATDVNLGNPGGAETFESVVGKFLIARKRRDGGGYEEMLLFYGVTFGDAFYILSQAGGDGARYPIKLMVADEANFFQAAQFDDNVTAGETRLLLWDIDADALVRVSVGASDSGGTGYKILRIPN